MTPATLDPARPVSAESRRRATAEISRQALGWTAAGAAGVGVIYTMSPFTIVFAIAIAGLFWLAGLGLSVAERRWVFRAMAAAVVLRILVVVILFVRTDLELQQFNAFFPDGPSIVAHTLWIRNLWLGTPIGPLYTLAVYDPYGASAYFYWLAILETIFGPAPYGLNLWSIGVFLAGAVALYRVVRAGYGPEPALLGLIILLFWPTLFAWSVSVLKDPTYFGLAAITISATWGAFRLRTWRARVLAIAVVAMGLAALSGLRSGGLVIVGTGITLGLMLWFATLRSWFALVAIVALLVAGAWGFSRPGIRNRTAFEIQLAAARHMGQVLSLGVSYRVLDQRFYSEGPRSVYTMTIEEGVRFVARSAAVFVLAPLPWQSASRSMVAYVPQQIVWYVLACLAVVGLVEGLRLDALLTCLVAGYAIMGMGVISLNGGNIGTLVRFRDMVVPFVFWLSALGACSIITRVMGRTGMARTAQSPVLT